MYHPAVALYNPGLKNTLKEDFTKLKDFLDNGCKVDELEKEFVKPDLDKERAVKDILDL